MEYVHGTVDRIHGDQLTSLWIPNGRTRLEREGVRFLSRRNHDGWLRFNEPTI
jgi:hypothetical protein